jgi:TIR domain
MQGFISYSHYDYAVCKELLTHLRTTEGKFPPLEFWHDERIHAGDHWSKEIEEAIARAELFIFLASPQFLASDYIFGKEIPAIKRQLRVCKGKAISVMLRNCDPEFALGSTQAVPTLAKLVVPIEKWEPRNDGFDTARDQIDAAIEHHFGRKPRRARWPRA